MGKYRVLSREWRGDGVFGVVVAAPWPRLAKTDKGARRAALRSDPMRKAVSTRIDRVHYSAIDGVVYHITAARWDLRNGR